MDDFKEAMHDAAFETATDWFVEGRSKRDVAANLRTNFREISAKDRQSIVIGAFESAKKQTGATTPVCRVCNKVYDDRLYMPDYCEVCGETSLTEPEYRKNSVSSITRREDRGHMSEDAISKIATEPWRLASLM